MLILEGATATTQQSHNSFPGLCCCCSLSLLLVLSNSVLRKAEHFPARLVQIFNSFSDLGSLTLWVVQEYPWEMDPRAVKAIWRWEIDIPAGASSKLSSVRHCGVW